MKKTITMLLLTALCMTVFTSCDTGSGLVAELLGGIRHADEHLYPIHDCIEEPEQAIEQASEQATVKPAEPYVIAFAVDSAREMKGGRTRRTYTLGPDALETDFLLRVGSNLEELAFDGWLSLAHSEAAVFGYSINGADPVFSASFATEPDAEIKESAATVNADPVSAFCILIPMDDLPWGTYDITLWCANYQNEAELDSNAEIEFFKIKVYKDSAYDDETACG